MTRLFCALALVTLSGRDTVGLPPGAGAAPLYLLAVGQSMLSRLYCSILVHTLTFVEIEPPLALPTTVFTDFEVLPVPSVFEVELGVGFPCVLDGSITRGLLLPIC